MKKTLVFITLFSLLSCSSKQNDKTFYHIKQTDEKIVFHLNDYTTNSLSSSQIFLDDISGIEYLVFQNSDFPLLSFYEMNTGKFIKDIKLSLEGPEGIPKFFGFKIKSKEEIYLMDMNYQGLSVIDWNGKLIKRIASKTVENKSLYIMWGNEVETIDNNLYFTLGINPENERKNRLKKSPLCAVLKDSILETLPFSYFDITGKENDEYIIIYYSRCFNGKQFIYSMMEADYIFVCNINHDHVKKINARSKYLPHREVPHQLMNNTTPQKIAEEGGYGKIHYDKYRDIYYRIVYPQCTVDPKIDMADYFTFGPSEFAIMILDNEFNIISETKMPKNTFCSDPLLIREDGIYLSESHFLNPTFDENELVFRKFKLIDE